jgi:hypothetical protein
MVHQKRPQHVTEDISDLALGEIHPKAELELLAHVAECEACREAYSEARAVRALIDRGVESLVAGEPSPQFDARLRASIAREPISALGYRNPLRLWEPATRWPLSCVAGVMALVVIIIFAMTSLTRRQRSAPLIAAVPAASTLPVDSGIAIQPSTVNPERHRTKLASRSSRSARTHREPEVLVSGEELRAVAQLYEATQAGRVDSERLYTSQQQTRQLLELKPIEITPLESPPVVPATDSANGPSLFLN